MGVVNLWAELAAASAYFTPIFCEPHTARMNGSL